MKPFNELSQEEKTEVRLLFEACMGDKTMNCHTQHKTIREFYEAHAEMDFAFAK